jgi:hypothetical protein
VPQPSATDDGTKITMAITNEALGPRLIGSDQTDGYRSNINMTISKPGSRDFTTEMTTTEYVTKAPESRHFCGGFTSNSPGPGAAVMSQYTMAQMAMAMNSPRFKVTSSGPALPVGRFSLFTAITMGSPNGAADSGGTSSGAPAGFASIIERGHERPITDDDPIFTIPPDYTKIN